MHEISLTHTIDTGHRIVGHENGRGKCARLHGHTYRYEIIVASPSLLPIGFVIDFGTIKRALDEWDHRMVLHNNDPLLLALDHTGVLDAEVVWVDFNPTAENMARYWANRLYSELKVAHGNGNAASAQGEGYAVQVEVWETPKSSARYVTR
jgi:6-pyruvoyltetrahydropterin/6-carboxytetrahydropterin synthase